MAREAGVVVAGEAIVDLSADPRGNGGQGLSMTARAGGSPANVAVGLARLGVQSRFAGRLSRDMLGSFLREHLVASGVDVAPCVDAPQPSTVAIVGVDDAGAAAYSFYVQGTADWQWERAELPVNEAAVAIHTGSLAITLEPGAQVVADWVSAQRARGDVFVSLDPNVRPELVADPPGYRRRLDQLIEQAHLIKVSDEDLRALEPGVEPLKTAAAWAQRGPELVVVTHGAHGSTALVAGREAVHCEAFPVVVVDTVGAGDAFTAGLLAFLAELGGLHVGFSALLDRATVSDALRFAAAVAAKTCARPGADPPWRAELDASPLADSA